MSYIEAIFRHGVFEPLQPVPLQENQRVQLCIATANEESPQAWLARVDELQRGIVQRQGVLPDSTPDIAADRLR